jgi:Cytochrome c7 and related cytochrome c
VSALPSPHPRRVPALFTSSATTVFRVLLASAALAVALSGTLAYAYFHSSYWNRIGMAPPQPILFSHRHHAGELRIDCRNCHATVETSAFAGMPSTETCLTCHSQIFTTTSMIRPLVQSAVLDIPLQWNRVNQLPAHVFFDHGIHVSKGVACTTCHGEVGTMALMAKGEPLTMRWCLDCHRNPGPRLSPRSEIFDAVSPARRAGPGPDLSAFYHVRTDSLTDCSTCHH